MADLSGYAKDMAYLEEQASKGTLTRGNSIYQKLKEKSRNLPNLASWLSSNIEPYIN